MATRARIVTAVYTFRSIGHTGAWLDPLEGPPTRERLSLKALGFEESHLDEIVGYALFACGFGYQLYSGFSLPFPLNLVFLPLTIIEWVLEWQIVTGAPGASG